MQPAATNATLEQLWQLSEKCTPAEDVSVYTQAIMDLGATVCTRRKPLCVYCPLAQACVARRTGRQHEFPAPRQMKPRRARHVFMLVAMREDGGVFLERRPESGIWGGLWCLPEFDSETAARAFAMQSLLEPCVEPQPLELIEHAFTHFDLAITPLLTRCAGPAGVMDEPRSLWYNPRDPESVGLPAPIKTLLGALPRPRCSTDDTDDANGPVRAAEARGARPRSPAVSRRARQAHLRECFEGSVAAVGGHQVMLLNEYRLTPVDPKARKFLEAEMEKFFFGSGSQAPEQVQAAEHLEPDQARACARPRPLPCG